MLINDSSPKKFALISPYRRKISMARWYIWQVLSAINPLIFYGTFLYSLIWSEVTGYNKLREEALFNATGVDKRFMNEWKYLTRWDHMVQLFFWFISVLAVAQRFFKLKDCNPSSNSVELIRVIKEPTGLQKFQDALFHSLAHPLAIVITALYWSMKLYDPTLLSGTGTKGQIPDTPIVLDHIVHTVVTVSCFIEFFLTYHKRPAWYWNIICPLFLLLIWILFDEYLKAYHGFAVYNVLNTTFYTLVICVVAVICVLVICLVLTKLHYLYWTEKRIDAFQLSPKLRGLSKRSYHA